MPVLDRSKRLKKELSLFSVYSLATGATLSSGFFLLPGLAAAQAGPAVTVSYLIAAIMLIPGVFSMAELSTAMPRAGGVYYFLDRSMGPLVGTIGGLGTWLALILKTAFALVGMGAYLTLFIPNISVTPVAIALAIIFGTLNLFGAKKTGGFQTVLVIGLLCLLALFNVYGVANIRMRYFADYFGKGWESIYATSGMVFISYVGLTKIASVSEEVDKPERNLPLGMLLALVTAVLLYGLGTTVMVGVLPADEFYRDLTPVATAANSLLGRVGAAGMTVAAVLAFFSVSNASIFSASRYPLAMSRDHLLPRFFRFLTKNRMPKFAIFTTVALVVLCLLLFQPTRIAKLAGAFQLLLFALSCLAVIIMRESHIASYDPAYRSPLYPWMQIFGTLLPLFLISRMGSASIFFTLGLIFVGIVWYYFYGRKQVSRDGAVFHIFARLGQRQDPGLDRELRGILQEKGLREEDPFDMVIARAGFLDFKNEVSFEKIVGRASETLAERTGLSPGNLKEGFMQGTRVGATPVSHGVALPHLRLSEIEHPELVMVRARKGVLVDIKDEYIGKEAPDSPVHAFFFLISPEEEPRQHLRLLAQIAEHAADDRFLERWLAAKKQHSVKALLHRDEHFLSLKLSPDSWTAELIGRSVRDLNMPAGSLIAIIHRGRDIVFPSGNTVLEEGDRLTIIGEPLGIQRLRQQFIPAD